MQSIFGNIFEISEWGASEIKEILSEGEKIIDDIEAAWIYIIYEIWAGVILRLPTRLVDFQ